MRKEVEFSRIVILVLLTAMFSLIIISLTLNIGTKKLELQPEIDDLSESFLTSNEISDDFNVNRLRSDIPIENQEELTYAESILGGNFDEIYHFLRFLGIAHYRTI